MTGSVVSNESQLPSKSRVAALYATNPISVRQFLLATTIVAVLMISAAWVWAIKGRMWFLDPEYPMWLANMQMLETCDVGETAILGDSRAKAAFIPLKMSDTVANLSLGGASPIVSLQTIESTLKCPVPPKRVVFAFAPSYFWEEQGYWERAAPFHYLSFDQMEEVRKTSLRLGDPILYSTDQIHSAFDKIRNYGYSIGFPSHYFPAMINAGFIGRKSRNDFELAKTLLDRGHHFFGLASRADWVSEEAYTPDFQPDPLLKLYFERSVALLGQRGIKAYFIGAPINESSYERMPPKFYKAFVAYLKDVEVRYPSFRVLGPPLPHLPDEDFGDVEHVNGNGAAKVSASATRLLATAISEEHDGGARDTQ